MRVVDLSQGWRVLQDVHDNGETLGLHRPDWNPLQVSATASPWEPLERLAHLQLLLSHQPYFGRALRHFNSAPWWYRLEFTTPQEAGPCAALRFEGVDYFAEVWLNGSPLGEHEGYFEAFEFEVGPLLRRDGPNLLVVKVSAPWDAKVLPGRQDRRIWAVIRNQIKGTYEHADTFVQRDVNPIGIWRPVSLVLHDGLRPAEGPAVRCDLAGDGAARLRVTWPLQLAEGERQVEFRVRVVDEQGAAVADSAHSLRLTPGRAELSADLDLRSPRLWSTWDRGGPYLYQARLEVVAGGRAVLSDQVTFGIRSVDLRRTAEETTFLLNREPIFLRGTTYFPDIYLSGLDRSRYQRDLAAMLAAGMNAIRVHVHVENPDFYQLCDRLGLLVLQDSDLNWTFPTDDAFIARARHVFGAMVKQLRNHPSVICWICMNEAAGKAPGAAAVGSALTQEAARLDPTRPTIRDSGARDDLESGDGHDYRGSLGGGHYTELYGSREKLATEFGVDAPPAPDRARLVPEVAVRLQSVLPHVAELHDYCYRLLKYFIEWYRMQKYHPCSGYFQFMWIDLCPQSFYGVYDYWGHPKVEGLGGGLRALRESNQPIGLFMEHTDKPIALWAVNDLPRDLGRCRAEWVVATASGEEVARGEADIALGPDSRAKVCDLSLPVEPGRAYRVCLSLHDPGGRPLAHNIYDDPFNHPPHPEGHPQRMDQELGMRLWWAEV